MADRIYHHEWCYLSGRINIQECYLLKINFFEKLLSSNNLNDVLTHLNNTPLKAHFTDVKHLYEFETLLDDYYYNRLYEIRSLSPNSAVSDFFLIKNDIINLKNFIKAAIQGQSIEKFLNGTINNDRWRDVWQGKEVSIPEVFKESISFSKKVITQHAYNQISPFTRGDEERRATNYPPILPSSQGGDEKRVKKESLPFIIDLICDGAYLRYIENFANEINVEIITRYLKIYQLVQGLKIIRRAMILKLDKKLLDQYFLEGFDKEHVFHKLTKNTAWISEKTMHEVFVRAYCNTPLPGENFVQILSSNLFPAISFRYEKLADNYLLDLIRPVKFIPFGPERVFGYLCGFTTEVFNLKLVLGGKVHRIEENLLKERLRKTYV
ncbi:MAG: V-type ATPase subunit [Candidatus Brocadia sp.]